MSKESKYQYYIVIQQLPKGDWVWVDCDKFKSDKNGRMTKELNEKYRIAIGSYIDSARGLGIDTRTVVRKERNDNAKRKPKNKRKEITEFTEKQAKEYLRGKGKKSGKFYKNVYGWKVYYTLEPTFATPTGKDKDFPRTVRIKP